MAEKKQQHIKLMSKGGYSVHAVVEPGKDEPVAYVVKMDEEPEPKTTLEEAMMELARLSGSSSALAAAGGVKPTRKARVPVPPLEEHEFSKSPWTVKEFAESNGLDYPSANNRIKKWLKEKKVEELGKEGRAVLYGVVGATEYNTDKKKK